MTWRRPLTEAQIRATLERHGYSPDTHVLGISRTDVLTTVNVYGAQLVVPSDVLRDPGSDSEPEDRRTALFDHGGA